MMDDPWGSPWTTADNDKDQKAPPSPTKSDLEPPPRAFLSVSSSPRVPTIVSQSPWADNEDGFGDWSAPTPDAGNSQSGWGGAWASPSPSLTTPSRDDEFGKSSPIAWPGSIALSKPRSSSIRQPSPDPWGSEFSARTPPNDGPSTPKPIPESFESELEENRNANIIITSEWDDHVALNTVKDEEEAIPDDGFTLPPPEEPSVQDKQEETTTHVESARSSLDLPVRGRTGRSSSPSDEESDQEHERQDSPITSIDEDSKARQKVDHKTSGKVQELVVKFDSIARAASQEPPVVSRARSKSNPDDTSRSPDAAEFGDFEDADEEVPRRPSTAGEQPSPPRSFEESSGSKSQFDVNTTSPRSNVSTVDSKRQSMGKTEAVTFDIDVSKIGDLLGKQTPKTAAELCDASLGISDHIITDSFTEISERKTWYRLSRLGSSRKHNAGDDENYRRVTWPTSTVRMDTIKIVRRWMEEDSIAGRANLGGGTYKTQRNMFGWDSSAEPVTLDAVFGKRKAHARASSLKLAAPLQPPSPSLSFASSNIETPEMAGPPQAAAQRPASLALPGPASFGWETESPVAHKRPVTDQQSIQSPVVAEVLPVTKPPPKPISKPTQPVVQQQSAQIVPETMSVTSNGSLSLANQAAPVEDEDDEDDWGEMVVSPAEAKAPWNGFPDIADAFSAPPVVPPATNVDEPPTSSGSATEIPNPGPALALATSIDTDAWASVDFSIFEKPVAGNQAANSSTSTAADTLASLLSPTSAAATSTLAGSTTTGVTRAAEPSSHFTPTTPLEIAPPVVVAKSVGDDLSSGMEDLTSPSPQDEAVLRIIANLPDLSYMLR
ncbi:hypothetical protein V8F06_010180 [Rhypophila decipiens]